MNTQTTCNHNTAVAIKPILWIAQTDINSDNFLESLCPDDNRKQLSKLFEVLEADNINIDGYQDLDSQQHIILIDNNTPQAELLVKRISWKIKDKAKNNPEILVLKTHFPLPTYNAEQLIDLIYGNKSKNIDSLAISFKNYCKQCNLEEIEPDNIDNHLINIIKYCPILSISDECEIIRIRSYLKFKPKEFQQKYMSLELKFKKELQKRGVIYDNPSLINEEEREELKQELNNKIVDVPDDLDLYRYLPEKIAYQLTEFSKILNIRNAFSFTAFLSVVSSLHKVGSELELYEGTDYIEVPNIWSMFVAPSGQKKSPVFKAIITKPLLPIKQKSREKYKAEYQQYKLDIERWKKDKENIFEPKEPHQTEHIINGTTLEALSQQINKCPNDGIVVAVDEIASLFESNNKYRGGKGDDKQQWLSLNNGQGITNLRVDATKRVDVDKTLVSVTGGIQPDVLKKYVGNLDDNDGFYARFLYVFQPLTASRLPDRKQKTNLNIVKVLEEFYSSIHELQKQNYKLSDDAYDIFADKEYKIGLRKVDNRHNKSLCTVLGKMPLYILRLALNLQTINNVGTENYSNIISAEIIRLAIELGEFYLNEILQFHSQIKAEKGELSEQLNNIIKLAKTKNNEVTTREASRIFSNNVRVDNILRMFGELQNMNFGEIITKGNSTKFKLTADTADTDDSKARTQSEKEMQKDIATDSRTDTPTDTNDSRTNKSTNMDAPVEPNKPSGSTGSNSGSNSGSKEESLQSSHSKDYKSSGSSGSSGSSKAENIQTEEEEDIYKELNEAEIEIIEAVEYNPDILVEELRTKLNVSSDKVDKIIQGLVEKNIFKEYQSIKPIEFTQEFKLKLEETPRKE